MRMKKIYWKEKKKQKWRKENPIQVDHVENGNENK